MWNLGTLISTVQHNCHVSDAQHAGDYTLCIYLLRMREFYRWEHEIPLEGPLPSDQVGTWLEERERMWDGLASSSYEALPLGADRADPFDSATVNRDLVPRGYVYSAGYGRYNKPHFFLGALERTESRSGFSVYVSSCEYARDLVAPPAMLLGRDIFICRESVRRFLWEKIEEWRWNRRNEAMARALAGSGFDSDPAFGLERMTVTETEAMILHELGEGMAGELLGEDWNAMLLTLSRSKAEIMARAVRDLIADCLSTLPALLDEDNATALHFYFATFSGMRRELYPDVLAAYRLWAEKRDRQALHRAISAGRDRWLSAARSMLDVYRRDGSLSGETVEGLLEPAVR